MAFKNLSSPSGNSDASPKAPLLKQPPIVDNRSENEERINTLRDGEEALPLPPVDTGHKPMRLKK